MTDARVRWITVALLVAVALYAFSRFELTESLHARIRAELDARATSP